MIHQTRCTAERSLAIGARYDTFLGIVVTSANFVLPASRLNYLLLLRPQFLFGYVSERMPFCMYYEPLWIVEEELAVRAFKVRRY